jgi:two-component system, cell cycle sensor histidine kinase and response regulator CckA
MTASSSEPTILVVEDQPEVLSMLADALKMVGYRVLTAAHPDDGLAIGDKHAEEIDLVLTDVVMPGMNGPEMAQRLVFRHPSLRVLYLSGHDRATLGPLGVPEDGPAFLKKPFTMDALVKRVSGALCR